MIYTKSLIGKVHKIRIKTNFKCSWDYRQDLLNTNPFFFFTHNIHVSKESMKDFAKEISMRQIPVPLYLHSIPTIIYSTLQFIFHWWTIFGDVRRSIKGCLQSSTNSLSTCNSHIYFYLSVLYILVTIQPTNFK